MIVRRVAQPAPEIDRAVLAKSGACSSAARIEREDSTIDGAEEDTAPARRVRRGRGIEPRRDAAIREVAPLAADVRLAVEDPSLASRRRIEGNDAAEWRREIQCSVDHERRRLEPRVATEVKTRRVDLTCAVGPRDGKMRDVLARDLG